MACNTHIGTRVRVKRPRIRGAGGEVVLFHSVMLTKPKRMPSFGSMGVAGGICVASRRRRMHIGLAPRLDPTGKTRRHGFPYGGHRSMGGYLIVIKAHADVDRS